jgi:hypothetical protein
VALASVDVGMKTSMLGTEGGGVFPSMTPAGGHLRGLPCLISSGIPSGQLALMDAVQIGAWAGPVAITASGQADIEMVDNPTASSVTPTGASMVSTFMTNSVAMRATAAIAITQLRPCAVLLSGVDWGASP